MRLTIKDFSLFEYTRGLTELQAEQAMIKHLTELLDASGQLDIELSKSTDSAYTLAIIHEMVSKSKSLKMYISTDRKESKAVITLSKKEEIK
jgi:hypothetical protein